jgi:hypothetical protein
MTLLNTSTEKETRIFTRVGGVFVMFVVITTVLYVLANAFERKPRDIISLAIDTPFVGQGVAAGTPVMMHGVKVGSVVSVSSIPGGGVRLETDLQKSSTSGLTDAMGIDYRPSNYFGVTGINVIPAPSGQPLRSGMQLSIVPKGNFSLQALLYRLGELSNGVFNQRLVSVIERATRYADGLNPLLETALLVATSVAKVQTVSTERLLRNTTGISAAFPGVVDALISTGDLFLHSSFTDFNPEKFKKMSRYYGVWSDRSKAQWETSRKLIQDTYGTDVYYDKHLIPTFDNARTNLFSRIGNLEGSHINDLFPLIESVRAITDAVPKIASPENFAYTLTEIRTRLERMYAGPPGQRAVQVRIMLDRLPGVASPLGLLMAGRP